MRHLVRAQLCGGNYVVESALWVLNRRIVFVKYLLQNINYFKNNHFKNVSSIVMNCEFS